MQYTCLYKEIALKNGLRYTFALLSPARQWLSVGYQWPGADCNNFVVPKSDEMPDVPLSSQFLLPPSDCRTGRSAPSVPLSLRHCSQVF